MKYFPPSQLEKNGAATDATLVTRVNGKTIFWEFKNELSGIQSKPNRQNIGNYIHLTKGSNERLPMLFMTVVGPRYFQVFGAV